MNKLILDFLRLFPQFKSLERLKADLNVELAAAGNEMSKLRAAVRETGETSEKYRLQFESEHQRFLTLDASAVSLRNENYYLRSKLDSREDDLKEMCEKRIEALETLYDFESFQKYGRTIFNRVPITPIPKPDFTKLQSGRRLASDVVRERERQFTERMTNFYNGTEPSITEVPVIND